MTIEPIGSMMSAQAVNYVPPKSEAPEAPKDGSEVAAAAQEAPVVDSRTATVKKSEGKEDSKQDSQGEAKQDSTNEQIKKKLEELTKSIDHTNEEAVFGIHKGTNRVTIKIVDKETKETIKELPPEKTLDMIAKLWEVAGIMVDEKR